MRKESLINISKERKAAMIADIKAYFLNEREEEIGDLAAGMVLDFIVEKLAPEFYNQGVDNAYRYMKESAEDMLGIRA